MTWIEKIPGCFGSEDLIFAGHPCDAERAWKWLEECREQNIDWPTMEDAVRQYLGGKLNSRPDAQQHIEEQVERVRKHCEAWL